MASINASNKAVQLEAGNKHLFLEIGLAHPGL